MASNCLKKPVVLVILDGFGYSKDDYYNAVYAAKKPNIDKWLKTYPNTLLHASGQYVGLLPGFIGNSEVGHCTIGCGRVIKQPLAVISKAIEDKSFFKNNVLLKALEKVKKGTNRLHIMGLLSDGGVHSNIDNLYAFLIAAKQTLGERGDIYLHVFLDGRDVEPKTAIKYLQDLDDFMKAHDIGVLSSIHGRFYAMDRDNNWDRTIKSYKVLVGDNKSNISGNNLDWEGIINKNYAKNITDEFIEPVSLLPNGIGDIKNGDGVIFFNFRPDRARQITKCLLGQKIDGFIDKKIELSCFVTPVEYDKDLKTDFMFEHPKVINTLKDVLVQNGKAIFSIAETEKYAHVTYFFNGGFAGSEQKLPMANDKQVLIKSKGMQSYAYYPQMSADKITDVVLESLNSCVNDTKSNILDKNLDDTLDNNCRDFYLINYANADMVGHSGDFEATVKAVEFLDIQLKRLYEVVIEKLDGTMYITADHGKAEHMFDRLTGQPFTAHTTNLVPFIFIKHGLEHGNLKLNLSGLADIAPFILKNMGISVPAQMQGDIKKQ